MPTTHRPTLSPTGLIRRFSLTTLSILLLGVVPAMAGSALTPPPLPASGDVLIAGGVGSDGNVTTQA